MIRGLFTLVSFVYFVVSSFSQTDLTDPNISIQRLRAMPEQYAKDGWPEDVVRVHQEIIERKAASEKLLGPRMVDVYIEKRRAKEALESANKVKDSYPDPQAYLSGGQDEGHGHQTPRDEAQAGSQPCP
jgi:hypothetical protein